VKGSTHDRVDPIGTDENVGALAPPVREDGRGSGRVVLHPRAPGSESHYARREARQKRVQQIRTVQKQAWAEIGIHPGNINPAEQPAQRGPEFTDTDLAARLDEAVRRADLPQGQDGLAPERDADADLSRLGRPLADSNIDRGLAERDCGRHAADAAADDDAQGAKVATAGGSLKRCDRRLATRAVPVK
jgi:hypothetical protein